MRRALDDGSLGLLLGRAGADEVQELRTQHRHLGVRGAQVARSAEELERRPDEVHGVLVLFGFLPLLLLLRFCESHALVSEPERCALETQQVVRMLLQRC